MKINESGYAADMYERARLRRTATAIAKYLPVLMRETGAEAVVVTGKSGIALAFATLMLTNFPLIVVRKRGENSHGAPIEGTPCTIQKYLILDDFIATGATVCNIVNTLEGYSDVRGEDRPQCVGVLQYQYAAEVPGVPDRGNWVGGGMSSCIPTDESYQVGVYSMPQ